MAKSDLVDQFKLPNRSMRHHKTRAKVPCKCLRCAKAGRESYDGKTWLICGDEACDMRCGVCTDRPNTSGCGFVEMVERVEVLA